MPAIAHRSVLGLEHADTLSREHASFDAYSFRLSGFP
jgi:hypothetical protein